MKIGMDLYDKYGNYLGKLMREYSHTVTIVSHNTSTYEGPKITRGFLKSKLRPDLLDKD